MTAARAYGQSIVYKRRRKDACNRAETHYLLVDEREVRVRMGALIYVEFDYNSKEPGPAFTTDYADAIYRYSDREWCYKRGTYFYPFATYEEVELFNAIIDEVVKHTA